MLIEHADEAELSCRDNYAHAAWRRRCSRKTCAYIVPSKRSDSRYRTVISIFYFITCWLSNYGPCQLDLECNRRTRQTKRVECRWKALAPVRCPEPYVDVRLHTARVVDTA